MDPRLFDLQRRLDSARGRVNYCRRQIERFDSRADPGDVMLDRARERLAEDLRRAELDAAWAMIALADATQPAEVPQPQETERCQLAGAAGGLPRCLCPPLAAAIVWANMAGAAADREIA